MTDISRTTPADQSAPLAEDLRTPKVEAVEKYEQMIEQQPRPRSAKEKKEQKNKRKSEKPSATELRAALDARTEQINRRVEAIQTEVQRVPEEVRHALVRNPVVSLGGSLVAGLAVGLLIGGIGKKKRAIPAAHATLVAEYLDALADDARQAIKKGEDVGRAIRRTIGKYTPLVVVTEPDSHHGAEGVFKTALDMAFKTALGFGVKILIDKVIIASGIAEEVPSVEHNTERSGRVEVVAAATE